MSTENGNLLQIGLDKSKEKLVSIYNVKTGKECECFCPECGEPLEAKNKGKTENEPLKPGQKIAHFAHTSGADCVSAPETVLHKMAKEVLLKIKKLLLPPLWHKELQLTEKKLVIFDKVEIEKTINDIVPDAILTIGNKVLLIEFYVTHKVDGTKADKIKKQNISCLEINLNTIEPLINNQINYQGIQDFLESNIWLKEWIHNSEIINLYEKKKSEIEKKKEIEEQKFLDSFHKEYEAERLKKIGKQEQIKEYNLKGFEQVKIYGRNENYFDNRNVFCPALKSRGDGQNKVVLRKCEDCRSHVKIIETDYSQQLVICGHKANYINEFHR